MPPSLKNRPELGFDDIKFWEAYNKLASSRTWTMGGPSSIPYTAISRYLDDREIRSLEERERYEVIIQSLDNAYLEEAYKKKEKK